MNKLNGVRLGIHRAPRKGFPQHNFPHINFVSVLFAFDTIYPIVRLYHTSSSSYTDSVFSFLITEEVKYPFVMQDALDDPMEEKKSHGNKFRFFSLCRSSHIKFGSESKVHLHKSTVSVQPRLPSSSTTIDFICYPLFLIQKRMLLYYEVK